MYQRAKAGWINVASGVLIQGRKIILLGVLAAALVVPITSWAKGPIISATPDSRNLSHATTWDVASALLGLYL